MISIASLDLQYAGTDRPFASASLHRQAWVSQGRRLREKGDWLLLLSDFCGGKEFKDPAW